MSTLEIVHPEKLLPQQPPILMLDRIVDIDPGKSGSGIRRFKSEDRCFEGHFPEDPVLPGVLIIEALAQTAMAVMAAGQDDEKPSGFLARVNNIGFYRSIQPDQDIRFQIEVTRKLNRFIMISGEALHNGECCAKGELTLAMGDSRAVKN